MTGAVVTPAADWGDGGRQSAHPLHVRNDFGTLAVDGALVDRGSYAVAELASGCVCCTLSAPMQDALVALLDDEQPDTILIETTGLAEPAAFRALFAAPRLATRIRLGNVVCVVDASTHLRYADHLLALPRQVDQIQDELFIFAFRYDSTR